MYQLCRYTRRTPLDTQPPIKYGDVIHPNDPRLSPATRARFLETGTLVKMELPPLAVLPDSWRERVELLGGANIFTIGDLLGVNERELAKALGVKPKVIRDWKTEAERWLDNPNQQLTND